MPYGEEIIGLGGRSSIGTYTQDDVRQGFTGYENDNESGLSFAQARMYKTSLGRFSGSDPLLSSGRPSGPQSWNRYAFSLNQPTILTDATGLYVCKNMSKKDCDAFEAARLKAKRNLVNIAEKYKDKGGTKSNEYKNAERAILAYGKGGVDNGVYIRKGGPTMHPCNLERSDVGQEIIRVGR